MTRHRAPSIVVCLLAAVALAGCGSSSSSKQATKPTAKSSATCFYTEAGNKLCGEEAHVYCEQMGGRRALTNGCGPILEKAARSDGLASAARGAEESEHRLYCLQHVEETSGPALERCERE